MSSQRKNKRDAAKRRSTIPKGRTPTIQDVAAYCGFSPMTVSRVINGGGRVKQESISLVRAAIAELGYSPNLAARSLAVGKQMTIGVLFNDASNTYSAEILTSCLEYARQNHVQIVVGKCDLGRHEVEVIRGLLSQGVDGVVVPPPLCDSKRVHSLFASANAPAVAIGSTRARTSLLTVRIDDYAAAAAMTRHLLSLQHKRIGFIVGDPAQGCSARRLAGFKAAMAEALIDVDDTLIRQGDFTYRSGLKATDELLKLPKPPTAIFASNDNMAAASVSLAHRYNLDVPQDLTVCGFDDTDISRWIWPELTTIRQPIADMARAALQMLIGAIEGSRSGRANGEQHRVLEFSLVRRESDAAPAPPRSAPLRHP